MLFLPKSTTIPDNGHYVCARFNEHTLFTEKMKLKFLLPLRSFTAPLNCLYFQNGNKHRRHVGGKRGGTDGQVDDTETDTETEDEAVAEEEEQQVYNDGLEVS